MNVKVITTALQHLVGGAALNVALGARLELATQEAIAARGLRQLSFTNGTAAASKILHLRILNRG